jgi:hypothetical protein
MRKRSHPSCGEDIDEQQLEMDDFHPMRFISKGQRRQIRKMTKSTRRPVRAAKRAALERMTEDSKTWVAKYDDEEIEEALKAEKVKNVAMKNKVSKANHKQSISQTSIADDPQLQRIEKHERHAFQRYLRFVCMSVADRDYFVQHVSKKPKTLKVKEHMHRMWKREISRLVDLCNECKDSLPSCHIVLAMNQHENMTATIDDEVLKEDAVCAASRDTIKCGSKACVIRVTVRVPFVAAVDDGADVDAEVLSSSQQEEEHTQTFVLKCNYGNAMRDIYAYYKISGELNRLVADAMSKRDINSLKVDTVAKASAMMSDREWKHDMWRFFCTKRQALRDTQRDLELFIES